jgi:predicted acylesterase/phospholipase RssA
MLLALLVGGCSVPRQPFTAEEQATARLPGIPNGRFWADAAGTADQATRFTRLPHPTFTYLALSGGGGNGAFGAGLLSGWARTGRRPEFTVVSGVSTGALIAPFAFLGPAYDETLRQIYTGGYGGMLLESPDLVNAVFGAGVFDSGRLLAMSRQFVTPDVIEAVAREHRRGRRLLVLTTNLDAQRPVLWNMGEIAASGVPGADELFRRVLTASASIPGVFTPTMITAESNGRFFEEMHVDGGVVSNVFVLPDRLLGRHLGPSGSAGGNIYVLMNGKLDPAFEVVENRSFRIAGRAVSTMIQNASRANLRATLAFARSNGMGFHLAALPPEVDDSGATTFETEAMRRLYAFGHDRAVTGRAWSTGRPTRTVAGSAALR